jgi:hypothetical protein
MFGSSLSATEYVSNDWMHFPLTADVSGLYTGARLRLHHSQQATRELQVL